MTFRLPESYASYITDLTIRTAVDHLLDEKEPIPSDMEWHELNDLQKSEFAAFQVRCDYAVFLHDVWQSVWSGVCDRISSKIRLNRLSIGDSHNHLLKHYGRKQVEYRPRGLWNSQEFAQIFDLGTTGKVIEMWVVTYNHDQVQLSVVLLDQVGNDITNDLKLGTDWTDEEIDDGYVYTKSGLAFFDENSIELGPLIEAAAEISQVA